MKKKSIIDTGKHLPKAGFSDILELRSNRQKIVVKPILDQSKKDGSVIYGRQAVNLILGKGFHRETYDFDVKSPMPLKHALQIEKSIDRCTNSNLAFIKKTSYPIQGRDVVLYRVQTRPHEETEVDYSHMPKNMSIVKVKGIKVEGLKPAEKKYRNMIRKGEMKRFPNAFFDLSDIQTHNLIRKRRI